MQLQCGSTHRGSFVNPLAEAAEIAGSDLCIIFIGENLVNIQKRMERSTMFNGKIMANQLFHFDWAMFNN